MNLYPGAPRALLAKPPSGLRAPARASSNRSPAGDGWLHEINHHGFRVLALKEGERVRVWSGRGGDFTERFARIKEAVPGLSADEALINGEAVVFRDDGRSDFNALLTKHGRAQAAFVVFDLLRLGGDDLRQRPLEKPREALKRQETRRRNSVQRGAQMKVKNPDAR